MDASEVKEQLYFLFGLDPDTNDPLVPCDELTADADGSFRFKMHNPATKRTWVVKGFVEEIL